MLLHGLLLFCFAVQWGQCEDKVITFMQEDPDFYNEVTEAFSALDNLWTVYLPKLLKSSNVSEACKDSTVSIILSSIQPNLTTTPKIIPIMDATGKQAAGLLQKNFFLVPAFDQCFKYNYTSYCKTSVKLTALPPDIRISWNLGLCVPRHCTPDDVKFVMQSTELFIVGNNIKCTDHKRPPLGTGEKIMIAVCFLFLALVCISTVIDWLLRKIDEENKILNGKSSSVEGTIEKMPLLTRTLTAIKPKDKQKVQSFLTAFSLLKTVPSLLSTRQPPGVITNMNGIRVISLFWIIMGHVYLAFSHGDGEAMDNGIIIPSIHARLTAQPLLNTSPAVDTFFLLSGILVAYNTLRLIRKVGHLPIPYYYLHRYFRLTPSYAFVLFFYWLLSNYIAAGPVFSFSNNSNNPCAKYWWTNLLYINNFYPWEMKDECMTWTWYLACDMQFYIISPLMLIPLYYLFPVGLIVTFTILACGFIITGTLAGVYDFQVSDTMHFPHRATAPHLTDQASQDLIYIMPYSRISAYIVGILLGFIFYKGFSISFGRLANRIFYLALWALSGAILLSSLYSLYFIWHGHVMTRLENVLFMTFNRFAWSVGVAIIIFACHNGYGGYINSFLSMKIWMPLAKLNYNAYLVHFMVKSIVYGQTQTATHMTDITMPVYVIGITVLSYATAALVCVCVEFPLGTVEMLIFGLLGLGPRKVQKPGSGAPKGKVKEGEKKQAEKMKVDEQTKTDDKMKEEKIQANEKVKNY